uniref:WAP domain-containing protein n=1 Tax=Anopheles farauti TaxID=69004 RepID=A0A182QBL6_9DIPT
MSSGSVLLLTVLLMGYIYWSLAQPTNVKEIRCRIRPVPDARNCLYGSFLDPCQQYSCYNGPGDKCSTQELSIILTSKCAEGLQCCNGKCIGCLNGKCVRDPCHPSPDAHHYQHRSDPYMQERYMDPIWTLFADYYSNK